MTRFLEMLVHDDIDTMLPAVHTLAAQSCHTLVRTMVYGESVALDCMLEPFARQNASSKHIDNRRVPYPL